MGNEEEEDRESDEETENQSYFPVTYSQVTQRSGPRPTYHDQRGVLSQQSTDIRNQRRLESAAKMPKSGARKRNPGRGAKDRVNSKIASSDHVKPPAKAKKPRVEESSDEEEPREVQQLRQQIETLTKQNQEQQETISDLSSNQRGARKKRSMGSTKSFPVHDKARQLVCDGVTTYLWPICKFLASEQQLNEACEKLMGKMSEFKTYLDDERTKEDYIMAFVAAYGETVCKALNNSRSDAQSGLKKEYERLVTNGEAVPTPAQLKTVILRKGINFDGEDPQKNAQERHWFLWYWQFLLPKVCGRARWGTSIRNFGTISGHAYPGSPKRKYVTPSDEALVLVLFENCGQRFPYTAECLKNGKKVDKKSERYQSKWTNAAAGQAKFGGWSFQGRVRFQEIQAKVKTARQKNRSVELEKWALVEIQRLNKIGIKRQKADSGPAGPDVAEMEEKLSNFLCESDQEAVDPEAEESDLEEIDDEYASVHVSKKARLSKKNAKISDDSEAEDDEEDGGGADGSDDGGDEDGDGGD